MKTIKKFAFLFFVLQLSIVWAQKPKSNSDVTKSLNQQSLDEFGVEKDSIKKNTFVMPQAEQPGNKSSVKDLNAQEAEKIKNINIKTKSLVNQDSLYWFYKKKWEDSVAAAEAKKQEEKLKLQQQKEEQKNKVTTPTKPSKITEPVKKSNDEDIFSTKPIIKGSKPEKQVKEKEPLPAAEEPVLPKKTGKQPDMSKSVKDFTFETQPIVAGKTPVSYSPDKVKKEPTVITNSDLSAEEEKKRYETYNNYQREADSARFKNQKFLDSVLASLSVKAPITVQPKDYIEIYLSGGGLSSDNKQNDHVSILQSGTIQREYTTKSQGEIRYEKKISKDELMKLAQYIADMGFFDFKEAYTCPDATCLSRMKTTPTTNSLTITVAIGKKRHTVIADIFTPNKEKNWVGYPATLEKIVNAIYSVAEK